MPWLAVLLVSACFASAMNHSLSGAWVPRAGNSASFATPAIAELPPATRVGNRDDGQPLDLACISRFAAYTASVCEAVGRCSMLVIDEPATMEPAVVPTATTHAS